MTSFAERYKKKEPFTQKKLDSSSDVVSDLSSNSNINKKPADINKKPVDIKKKALASLIYLVKGVDAGRNAWYYVLVDRPKVQLFLKALNNDIIHLEEYGKILYSAYGDEPPAEITTKLKEEYGID